METAKTKIEVFFGTLPMEFDCDIVNFKINDGEIPTNNLSVNFLGTNGPLFEDCCEFSNHLMKDLILDKRLSDNALKELKRNILRWIKSWLL